VLRKVQKQELGTVAEVKKEVEHEAGTRLALKSSRSCCVKEARPKERVVQLWNLLQMALKNSRLAYHPY